MAQENVLCKRIVEHAPSTANHGLAFAGEVVGKRNARGKVIQIFVVELTSGDFRGAGGVEAVEQIILLMHHAEVVPTQAEVYCQAWSPAEAVLDIEAMTIFGSVPQRIALPLSAIGWQAS